MITPPPISNSGSKHDLIETTVKKVGIFGDRVVFSGNTNFSTNGEQWLWSLLEPHVDVLVDVGVCKTLTFPDNGRTVQHCFEPNPTFCTLLKQFESPTVMLNNVGLGSAECMMNYYAHGETMHYRPVLCARVNCPCKQIVNVTMLDSYCQRRNICHIDFIKIDVEGHELEVLKGATNILGSTEFIQFEYGGTYKDSHITLAQVYDFLKTKGFTFIYLICPDYLCLVTEPIENYSYSNYLACRHPPHILIPDE